MTNSPVGNLIFISYRRDDAAPYALALKLELETELQAAHVFLDTHAIEGGEEWPDSLRQALASAKVVLPVFGHKWDIADASGRRRIDDPSDWVFQELKYSLEHKSQAIVPVLVSGAPAPKSSQLPPDLRGLANIQAIKLDTNLWDATSSVLIKALEARFGLDRRKSLHRRPRPDRAKARTPPYPWDDLVNVILAELPAWRIEFSDDPNSGFRKRVSLTRTFHCARFNNAVKLINMCAAYAEEHQHHPHIVNSWKDITISLSTWDTGGQVTAFDLQFARFVDKAFLKLHES